MKSLGKDELEMISKKLTFNPDYTRFRSVCRSWRSAAPKRPQLPWLIASDLHVAANSDIRTRIYKFYELSFETNKFAQIPELSELSSSSLKMSFIFYSHGWLALFKPSTLSVSLFNPLTNSSIHLPVLKILRGDTSDEEEGNDDDDVDPFINFYLTSDPGESLSDCFALVFHSFYQRILYCKVGCTDWIEMPHPEFREYCSIHICCYRGKTFLVSDGEVFACDFGLSKDCISVQKIVSSRQYCTEVGIIKDSYLVESDGDLLLVLCRYSDFICGDELYCMQVFKLEFGCEVTKLVLLKSLGDKALFLSPWTAFSLTASKYAGCKANSIYSTYRDVIRDELSTYDHLIANCWDVVKLSIYDFEKGSDVIISDNDVPLIVDWGRCGWFTPSLLK